MADFYATAVIGVQIDKDLLYEEIKTQGCSKWDYDAQKNKPQEGCPIKDGQDDVKFCSECGHKGGWKTELTPIKEWDEEENFGDYKIYDTTEGGDFVVGIVATEKECLDYGSPLGFAEIPDNLPELKKGLKKFLSKFGMWDEEKFGMYMVGYCSF